VADAGLHLAGRLVGEGDGEDLVRPRAAGVEQMRDARGQRLGLAGAGPGEDEDGAVERFDGGALGGVEVVEIGRGRRGHGADGERPLRRPVCGLEGVGFVACPGAHGRRR